jgi:hypothetical protein
VLETKCHKQELFLGGLIVSGYQHSGNFKGESMKTGFHDPIANKIKEKTMKSPWNFDCPPYDERSSCYVNAGSHYGVGHRQPVGHKGVPASKAAVLPEHRVKTMKDDEVPRKNLNLEIDI